MHRTIFAALTVFAVWLMGAGPASAADVSCFPDCYFNSPSPSKQVSKQSSKQASARPTRQASAGKSSTASRNRSANRDSDSGPRRRAQRGSIAISGSGGSTGVASYYWQPQRVASGGWFNPSAMTAAHKTLPFGTRVRVTHLGNGRSVDVTINDRGPYIAGRIIDLSKAAAGVIGLIGQGVAHIRMSVLGR